MIWKKHIWRFFTADQNTVDGKPIQPFRFSFPSNFVTSLICRATSSYTSFLKCCEPFIFHDFPLTRLAELLTRPGQVIREVKKFDGNENGNGQMGFPSTVFWSAVKNLQVCFFPDHFTAKLKQIYPLQDLKINELTLVICAVVFRNSLFINMYILCNIKSIFYVHKIE